MSQTEVSAGWLHSEHPPWLTGAPPHPSFLILHGLSTKCVSVIISFLKDPVLVALPTPMDGLTYLSHLSTGAVSDTATA